MTFVDSWRRRKSAAFQLETNSTAGRVIEFDLWGRRRRAYANANLSVYSAQPCNARCPFCVEELRPASRGVQLAYQKSAESDDRRYFARLERTLHGLRPLDPSVSVTGGEPSRDPRLPAILRLLAATGARKRTITTNGSGLLDVREGKPVLDWITDTGVRHLNISRAHPDCVRNSRIMMMPDGLPLPALTDIVAQTHDSATRVRLSCVLVRGAIEDMTGIQRYIEFASGIGVRSVIFRQLMKTDPTTIVRNHVVRFSDGHRVPLEGLLDQISRDSRFEFQKQIVGYYYYVEVWRYQGLDVVFEEADLSQLERAKRCDPDLIHELIFHPNARLASTWQPWDGVLDENDD
jgi:cyclic pyranopterin phosphate synthase